MERHPICRTAENLPTQLQPASQQRWGIAPSRFNRGRSRGYYPTHDTAQTRANWTRNPVASRSLDRCDAARVCDAGALRRLNTPDARPPSPRDWHTDDAGRPAQSDERHPTTGNKTRCATPQPDSPHPEQHAKRAPVEGRGRAHHREPHRTIPLRLADDVSNPPPPASQVEARSEQRRGIASISPQDWRGEARPRSGRIGPVDQFERRTPEA